MNRTHQPNQPRGRGRPHGRGTLWDPEHHPTRPPRPQLSREEIVRAAIRIADAEGADAISMRRIASALRAGAMSLYWHISSKEELIDLVIDEVFGELKLPDSPTGDWRADLRLWATEHRKLLLRHPWVIKLLAVQSGDSPNSLRTVEFSLAALDHLPISFKEKIGIFWTIHVYTEGYVTHEAHFAEVLREKEWSEGNWQEIMEPHLLPIVESGNYPHIAAAFADFPDFNTDKQFEFGLDSLLDGISARIESDNSRAPKKDLSPNRRQSLLA